MSFWLSYVRIYILQVVRIRTVYKAAIAAEQLVLISFSFLSVAAQFLIRLCASGAILARSIYEIVSDYLSTLLVGNLRRPNSVVSMRLLQR